MSRPFAGHVQAGLGFTAVAALLAAAAFALVVVPRADYPYPIHVDEWTHLAYAEALVQQGNLPHTDPLYGQEVTGFRPQLGFRVLLAELYLITRVDWEAMFPLLAGGTFVLFAVTMLYLGRVIGAGPLVGILALGTPTTLRFLGPAFIVPVALGMTLLASLPLVILQPSWGRRWPGTVLVGLLLLALLLVHPSTALVGSLLVVGISAYLAVHGPGFERAPLWACAALGVLMPVAWFVALPSTVRGELLGAAGQDITRGEGLVATYVYHAGYVRLALFAVASFAIVVWKLLSRPALSYLVLLAVPVSLVGYIRLHEVGIAPGANFYDRSWLYLDMALSIMGGVGLTVAARRLALPRQIGLQALRYGGLVLALGAAVVANAWYTWASEPHYWVVSAASVEDLRWVRENLGAIPGLMLADPRVAVAYPAIAGRPVYASEAMPRPSPEEQVDRAFYLLHTPQPDVAALRQEGIGVVYWPSWRATEGLMEVRPGVFVVVRDEEERVLVSGERPRR